MEQWKDYKGATLNKDCIIDGVFFSEGVLRVHISDSTKRKIIFRNIYSYKYSNESGIIDRLSAIPIEILKKNRIFQVDDSNFAKDYEFQASGTRPMKEVRHFVIMDAVDTVIEILSVGDPEIEGVS